VGVAPDRGGTLWWFHMVVLAMCTSALLFKLPRNADSDTWRRDWMIERDFAFLWLRFCASDLLHPCGAFITGAGRP
jgi:hypothetical protein